MLYCEKCRMMADNGRCDSCKGKGPLRQPLDNDPVLLAKTDQVSAAMLEGILQDESVPFLKEGRMGAGMTTWAGGMLEEYSFYVPYGVLNQAAELAKVVFDGAPDPLALDAQEDEDMEEMEELAEQEEEDMPF